MAFRGDRRATDFQAGLDRLDAIIESAELALRLVNGGGAEFADRLDIGLGRALEIADDMGHWPGSFQQWVIAGPQTGPGVIWLG